MANNKKITVEPISFGMSGFKVEELFSDDLVAEVKKQLPTSIFAHLCIGFTDSKDMVSISHDRKEGKFILDRVDIEGTNPEFVIRVVDALKKVLI